MFLKNSGIRLVFNTAHIVRMLKNPMRLTVIIREIVSDFFEAVLARQKKSLFPSLNSRTSLCMRIKK